MAIKKHKNLFPQLTHPFGIQKFVFSDTDERLLLLKLP